MNTCDLIISPCDQRDFEVISKQGHFCFPPFDPTIDDDPTSLDSFFCNVAPFENEDHFCKTYKFTQEENKDSILALASISNSSILFDSYEDTLETLRNSGFNEAFPAVMLTAFGVKHGMQGQGIGTKAFKLLIQKIRQESIAGVRLLTLHPLPNAIPFYEAQGCHPFYDENRIEIESMVLDLWQ